jgi:AraC-like DNA-binding protein
MSGSTAPADRPLDMPASAMLFESNDLDHAREQIGRVYCPYRFHAGTARTAHARMHNLPGAQVGLSRFSYGADITIEPELFGDFVLVLSTLAGRAEIDAGRCRHAGGPGATVLVAHDVPSRYVYSADNVQLVARIPVARIAEVQRGLFGRAPGALVSQTLPPPQHARWLGLLGGLQQLLHPATPAALRTLLLPRAEEMLIASLAWDQADSTPDRAAPACLRRALDFMDQHAGEPLTLARIAAAASCSARTLHRVFQQARGTTPLQQLKQIRLARVRQDLLAAQSPGSVTEIALRWGFVHLGQFSVDYRQAFGEKPSETLRRRA